MASTTKKYAAKAKTASDHHNRGGAHLLPGRPSDALHFELKLVEIVFNLRRPTRGLLRETHFFCHIDFLLLKTSATRAHRAWPSREGLAGAEGFEPPLAVLETAGLPLNLRPYNSVQWAC